MLASYLNLYQSGELAERVQQAQAELHACRLCGWDCGIDRAQELGPCRTGMKAIVSTAYIHFGEERPLSRQTAEGGGAGAIFFANCDLRCQFCQTARWNIQGNGRELSAEQVARLMLDLQAKGANNINLVTPTHVASQILQALLVAVERGLTIPLVWNSGGYDSPATLALLDGIVDIYLPDMKYSDSALARSMSVVRDYAELNQAAVAEMHRQVGDLQLDDLGVAQRGLLVRHLVMPQHHENSAGVLHWIADNLGPNTYLSLMDQYRPAYRAFAREDIGRAIRPDEYARARDLALSLGLTRLDDHLLYDDRQSSLRTDLSE
ncbi:MAG: radical SAM protein [Chloroflexi bacterium]|nr:radical SAM protein [Chloroflexota bacterium]